MKHDVFSKHANEIFDLSVSQEQFEKFCIYVELIRSWVDRVRLISTHDKDVIWERHILDCLSIVTSLPNKGIILDMGSGSGLPGVPIKIMRSDLQVVLLEPARMKSLFLQQVVETLQLPGLICIRERAENLSKTPKHQSHYNAVVARAVASLPKLWTWAKPLLNPMGQLISMKGPNYLLDFGGKTPEGIKTKEQVYHLRFIQRDRVIVTLSKNLELER